LRLGPLFSEGFRFASWIRFYPPSRRLAYSLSSSMYLCCELHKFHFSPLRIGVRASSGSRSEFGCWEGGGDGEGRPWGDAMFYNLVAAILRRSECINISESRNSSTICATSALRSTKIKAIETWWAIEWKLKSFKGNTMKCTRRHKCNSIVLCANNEIKSFHNF